MPNKNCPFCKNIVSTDDAVCPHCKRIIFEKIFPKPTYSQPDNQNIHQRTFDKKIDWKNKVVKIFQRLAFWKKISFTRQKFSYVNYNKWDKYKKIGLIVTSLLFFFGFYLRNHNLSISNPFASTDGESGATQNQGIIREDRSRHYLQTFKTIGDELAKNVKSVAKFQGTKTDNKGRLVNQYLYENKNLNIQIFSEKWNVINTEYKNLKLDIFNGKLSDPNRINEVLNYYKTVYFFAANEIWFRNYDNGNKKYVQKITDEIKSTVSDEYFNNYLKNANELIYANELLSGIESEVQNLDKEIELESLKNRIDSCEYSGNCGNYNYLIDRYNALVAEYNARVDERKELFTKFINLVDVYLIFPGQETIEQTTIQ